MKRIIIFIAICIIIGVVGTILVFSPVKLSLFNTEPTSTTIKTEIGDFRDILKLSVLDVDIEDAYPLKVDNRSVVYKIPAHCEFKYDLEKIVVQENDSSITVQLPRCVPEITTKGKSPTILYEEEGRLSAFIENNISEEGDKKALKILTDRIKKRVEKEYQELAFEQARNLLENFYSNTGKKCIIKNQK